MQALLFYSILSAAMFYLGSRAMVTQWLWSRYSPGFARFADCAACTGWWFGFTLSLVFGGAWGSVFTDDMMIAEVPRLLLEAFLIGMTTMITTPLIAGLHHHAMLVLGSAVDQEADHG